MASASQIAEKRPLKRSRQGVPPDVYLQEPKQEEDKLGADKLKNGYCNQTHSYEYESVFNSNNSKQPKLDRLDDYTAKSIQAYNQIIIKKTELNASLDRDRKKQWGKESIGLWHAAAGKQKEKDMWFKDLAGGSKSLISLAKRPPFFNKKEEAFSFLCDFNIPMSRAIWFLKMSNAATQSHQNPTKKKNSSVDTNLEHTQMFNKFLKDLLGKLASYYDAAPGSVSVESTPEYRTQWPYFTRLARNMYEEGLFDRHDMVSWIVDVFAEKCITKPETGGVLKLFLPFMMQYMDGIVQNVLLSRRCAMVACKKLQQLYMDHDDSNIAGVQTPGGSRVPSPVQCYQDYLNCGFHRQLVLCLSAMVHMIMLDCPAALVWNYWSCNEAKYALLCGSPLDALPCAPSMLPMAPGPANDGLRHVLRMREQEIIRRSRAVENHWSLNRSQQSGFGNIVSTVLEIIEALDNHKFEKNEDLDQLYSNVFPSAPKDEEDNDDIVRIQLLCHWAISAQRIGSHRALAVVRLLEKRLEDMRKENVPSEPLAYPFHQFLYAFLENEAPSPGSPFFALEFASVTLLFSELIRADLFSHDLYVSWLIANGEVNSSSPSEYDASGERTVGDQSWFGEKVRTPMSTASSAPDSTEQTAPSSVESLNHDPAENGRVRTGEADGLSRHQRYLLNFPIPQDEDFRHECNQRQTLLWGFGDERESHRHSLKKLTKELCKNWLKKNCYEVSDKGAKFKRKAPLDQLTETVTKFRSLVYYDQVVVTGLLADAFVDLLREFIERDGSTLPSSESLDVLLGLMENATNIYGIVDLAEEIIDLLITVERYLKRKDNQLAGHYGPQLALTLAGYLRHHYAFLLLCDSEAKTILNGLIRLLEVTKDSCRPLTSNDRCLMIFAGNLCKVVQPKEDVLSDRLLHYLPSKNSTATASNAKFNAHFFRDQLDNPKRSYDAVDMRNKLDNDAGNRYSFVVNTFLVAKQLGRDLERLNELAVLCANVTASCSLLEAEWLGAIRALCCSSVAGASISQGFSDLLIAINVEDPSSHYAIATLTMLLAARACFNVEVLIMCLIRSSFAAMIKSEQPGKSDVEAEAGVCLGLRIVTAVLCMDDQPLNQSPNFRLRLNADRYMLSEGHDIMNGEAVATILITICSVGIDTKQRRSDASVGDGTRESVVDLASVSLVAICEQEWVTRLCLNLTDNLRAKFFNHKHLRQNNRGQHLLRLAIRRKRERPVIAQLQAVSESKKGLILKLLSTLSVWNMQATTLDLQQLLREVSPESSKNPQQASIEMAALMGQIGLCCRELFSTQSHKLPGDAPVDNSSSSSTARSIFSLSQVTNFWLVAPLISRLPSGVQGKVLNEAASMLESGQTNRKERIQQRKKFGDLSSAWLLSQQPFLSLVLTCLRGQDEQRESLVNSLLKQLQDLAQRAKDDPTLPYQRDFGPERDGLLLRLSLVGGMFETVCKSSNCDMWALLLLQLMLYRVVQPDRDRLLFESCYDMLTTLIHCSLVEPVGAVEDAKPKYTVYFSIVKKLRKELSERLIEPDLRCLHQLIPLPRISVDIMTVEPYGTLPQSPQKLPKGQSSSSQLASPRATRTGLQFAEKQRMSPWDMIEGWSWTDQTSSGKKGWNWSWFQAVKIDSVPDTAQMQLQRLIHHEHYHWFRRPGLVGDDTTDDVFLEPPKTEPVEGVAMPPRMAPQPDMVPHQQQQQQQMMAPGQPQMMPQRVQQHYQPGQITTPPIMTGIMGPPPMHPQMGLQQQSMAQFPQQHMEPPRITSPRGGVTAARGGGRQRKASAAAPAARTGRKNSKGSSQQQQQQQQPPPQIPAQAPYFTPASGAPNQSSWPAPTPALSQPPVNPPAQYVPGAQAISMAQTGTGKERVHQMILQRTTNQGQQHIQQQQLQQHQQMQQVSQRQQHQIMDVGPPLQPPAQPMQPQMQPQPVQTGLQRQIPMEQPRQMPHMQSYGHGGFPQAGMSIDQQQYQRQFSSQQSFDQQRSQQEMMMRQNSGGAMAGGMQPQFAQQRMPQGASDQFQQQQYAPQQPHQYR